MEEHSEQKSLTVADLSARWKVDEETIRRLVRSGELQAFRVGRAIRFKIDVVEAYERANLVV